MGSDCSWGQGFILGWWKCSEISGDVNILKNMELHTLKW